MKRISAKRRVRELESHFLQYGADTAGRHGGKCNGRANQRRTHSLKIHGGSNADIPLHVRLPRRNRCPPIGRLANPLQQSGSSSPGTGDFTTSLTFQDLRAATLKPSEKSIESHTDDPAIFREDAHTGSGRVRTTGLTFEHACFELQRSLGDGPVTFRARQRQLRAQQILLLVQHVDDRSQPALLLAADAAQRQFGGPNLLTRCFLGSPRGVEFRERRGDAALDLAMGDRDVIARCGPDCSLLARPGPVGARR